MMQNQENKEKRENFKSLDQVKTTVDPLINQPNDFQHAHGNSKLASRYQTFLYQKLASTQETEMFPMSTIPL